MVKKAATRAPPKRARLYRKTPQKPVEPPWEAPAWNDVSVVPPGPVASADVELRVNGAIIEAFRADGPWRNMANGKVVDVVRWRARTT